jgi:hypothetical protein
VLPGLRSRRGSKHTGPWARRWPGKLDLAFLYRDEDDRLVRLDIVDTGIEGVADATLFAEAPSGLLDDDGLGEAASVLEPELGELKAQGILSEAEFEAEKAKILAS